MVNSFTHLDAQGNARMVNISAKSTTRRLAVACAELRIGTQVGMAIAAGKVAKGNVFAVARVAGIQAAKRTWELIPLCHTLALEAVDIDIQLSDDCTRVIIQVQAYVEGRTGVEMEALTGASVAALTVYDMCKAMDKGMEITSIRLERKLGGKSGDWRR